MDGKLLSVGGKLGRGAYVTEAPANEADLPAMQYLWDKTAESGYNKGCLIVMKLDGLTVRAKQKVHDNMVVPAGSSLSMIYIYIYCGGLI